jgi:hypothetical protein
VHQVFAAELLFETMYSEMGRPSIAPEKLLRALLLQVLYTVRSEGMLMEQLNYNLLFRWFVGLNMDEAVWHATGVLQEPGPATEGRCGQGVLPLGGGRGHRAGTDVR